MADAADRRQQLWLAVSLLLLALLYAWLISHGFPRHTSDSVIFKQPAYMLLARGEFVAPTYEGTLPFSSEVFAVYPGVYPFLNYLVFKVFGYGMTQTLAFDLFVHWIGAALIGLLVLKKTRSGLLAAGAVAACVHLVLPVGRPDNVATFLGLAAFYFAGPERPKWWLVTLLLGLAAASGPWKGPMIGGFILLHEWFRHRRDRLPRVARAFVAVTLAGIFAGVIWALQTAPEFEKGYAQFQALGTKTIERSIDFMYNLRSIFWSAHFLPLCALILFFGARRLKYWRESGTTEEWRPLLLTTIAGIPLVFGLNLLGGRPTYDYRPLNYLLILCGALLLDAPLGRARAPNKRLLVPITAAALAAFCLFPCSELVRYSLAPLAWDQSSISPEAAEAELNALGPKDATIGGEGGAWPLVTDGRPFYGLRWIGEKWPDYIVSSSWAREPNVMVDKTVQERLAKEYIEITTDPPIPAKGCRVSFFGIAQIPVATGACDWRLRIWKRQPSVQ